VQCAISSVNLWHNPTNCSRVTDGKVHASYVKCPYFLAVHNKLEAFVAEVPSDQKWISRNIPAMLAEIRQKLYSALYVKFA